MSRGDTHSSPSVLFKPTRLLGGVTVADKAKGKV